MSFITHLKCSRCGTVYARDTKGTMCARGDRGRLDFFYDYAGIGRVLQPERVGSGSRGIWRWGPLLPVGAEWAPRLGEGETPLLRADRLAEVVGVRELWLKDETRNPTGSFKDRAMAVGVARALESGHRVCVTASSGNAAAALAAYAAAAGLVCVAFVLAEASPEKLAQLSTYGTRVIRVRGVAEGEDPTVRLLQDVVRAWGWYPCPSFGPFNPYQVEGPKTLSYELAESFNWDQGYSVFVPTGSTCLLTGIWRGFEDLHALRWVDGLPRLVAVQPAGNAPFVRAVDAGLEFDAIRAEPHPATIASGLSDPYPWDADAGLQAVRRSRGAAIAVSDARIMEAVRLLARHAGVFAEPSGAAGLAGLMDAVERRVVDRDERCVVLVTGSGLKDPGLGKDVGLAEPVPPTLVGLQVALAALLQ